MYPYIPQPVISPCKRSAGDMSMRQSVGAKSPKLLNLNIKMFLMLVYCLNGMNLIIQLCIFKDG